MAADIMQEQILCDDVLHWVTDDLGYHAYSRGGLVLSIVRSASIQPTISDEQDYVTWLWVEALQGFFVMRQRIVETQPQGWVIVRRLTPSAHHGFFADFRDGFEGWVEGFADLEVDSPDQGGGGAVTSSVNPAGK